MINEAVRACKPKLPKKRFLLAQRKRAALAFSRRWNFGGLQKPIDPVEVQGAFAFDFHVALAHAMTVGGE